jgi:hypothetical protein
LSALENYPHATGWRDISISRPNQSQIRSYPMPFVFKDPKGHSPSDTSKLTESTTSSHDPQSLSSLLESTSLTPIHRQPEVHKLDKSPLGSRTRNQTQEERRKKALQLQKRSRQNQIEYARKLAFEKITLETTTEDDDDAAAGDHIVDETMGEPIGDKERQKRTKRLKQQNAYR